MGRKGCYRNEEEVEIRKIGKEDMGRREVRMGIKEGVRSKGMKGDKRRSNRVHIQARHPCQALPRPARPPSLLPSTTPRWGSGGSKQCLEQILKTQHTK